MEATVVEADPAVRAASKILIGCIVEERRELASNDKAEALALLGSKGLRVTQEQAGTGRQSEIWEATNSTLYGVVNAAISNLHMAWSAAGEPNQAVIDFLEVAVAGAKCFADREAYMGFAVTAPTDSVIHNALAVMAALEENGRGEEAFKIVRLVKTLPSVERAGLCGEADDDGLSEVSGPPAN